VFINIENPMMLLWSFVQSNISVQRPVQKWDLKCLYIFTYWLSKTDAEYSDKENAGVMTSGTFLQL
jgi:hypothetical protein